LTVKPGTVIPEQVFKVYPRDLKGRFLFSAPDKINTPQIMPAASYLGKVTFPGFTAEKEGFYRITFATGGASHDRA